MNVKLPTLHVRRHQPFTCFVLGRVLPQQIDRGVAVEIAGNDVPILSGMGGQKHATLG